MDILGTNIPVSLPRIGGGMAVNTWTVVIILVTVVIVALGAIGLWFIHDFKVYDKKIEIYENLGGSGFKRTGKDRARTVKLGNEGFELLYLKKRKVHRSAYGKRVGNKLYWFFINSDGYWYNCVPGDLDAKLGVLDVEPTSLFARGEYTAMAQNIERNYTKKPSLMEKYGTIIISGVFLIILAVLFIVIVNKFNGISANLAEATKTSIQLQESNRQIVSSLDNILNRGGGLVPAG